METINIKEFVSSYLQTAAFVTCDSDECTEFTKSAKKIALNDCLLFIDLVKSKLGELKAVELLTVPGNDLTYLAPHCFFLNRNRHGSGFWDREAEFGEYTQILSEICHEVGGADCWHVRGKKSKLNF